MIYSASQAPFQTALWDITTWKIKRNFSLFHFSGKNFCLTRLLFAYNGFRVAIKTSISICAISLCPIKRAIKWYIMKPPWTSSQRLTVRRELHIYNNAPRKQQSQCLAVIVTITCCFLTLHWPHMVIVFFWIGGSNYWIWCKFISHWDRSLAFLCAFIRAWI